MSQYIRVTLRGRPYSYNQFISWSVKEQADQLKKTLFTKERFAGHLLAKRVPQILVQRGILPLDYKQQEAGLYKELKRMQRRLYDERENEDKTKRNRQLIEGVRKSLLEIQAALNSLLRFTLEEYIDWQVQDFVLTQNLSINGKKVGWAGRETFLQYWLNSQPLISDIRKIARTDPWRSMWHIKRATLFSFSPLTDHQLALGYYSRLYDSVEKAQDPPSASVIDDDDMLDGWFLRISMNRELDEKQPKKQHSEVFIIDPDPRKRGDVEGANSPEIQAMQRLRMQQLRAQGAVQLQNFADIKQKRALK